MDNRLFLFYATWLDVLAEMSDEEQLEYFHAITSYGLDGKLPEKISSFVRIAMKFVCKDIDAAKERQENFLKKQRENGAKGGRPKKNPTDISENPTKPKETQQNPKNPTVFSETQKSHNKYKVQSTKYKIQSTKNKEQDINISPLTPLTGAKVKKESLLTRARAMFEGKYEELCGSPYYWTGKDSSAMKELLKKLTHSRIQKQLTAEDDEVLKSLSMFLASIRDEWLLKNFSVSVINSKYNEIISQAHGYDAKRMQRSADAARLVARLAAEEARDN